MQFPNSTSFENNEPRLLLVVIDIQEDVPVVFDRYEKEYGTRYREFEFDNKLQEEYNDNNNNKGMFKQVIR